mgnify:CR=1 FL=1
MEVEYCPQCTCPPEYCEYVACARGAAEKLEKVALDGDADASTARENNVTASAYSCVNMKMNMDNWTWAWNLKCMLCPCKVHIRSSRVVH